MQSKNGSLPTVKRTDSATVDWLRRRKSKLFATASGTDWTSAAQMVARFFRRRLSNARDCASRLRSATEDFKSGHRRVLIVEPDTDIIGLYRPLDAVRNLP